MEATSGVPLKALTKIYHADVADTSGKAGCLLISDSSAMFSPAVSPLPRVSANEMQIVKHFG